MTTNALAKLDVDAPTAKRAQYEAFEFTLEAPGLVRVTNGSYGADAADHTYAVTVADGVPVACECPADEYQTGACKHRVAVAIRGPVLAAAIDRSIDGHRDVATDGGAVLEECDGTVEKDSPESVSVESGNRSQSETRNDSGSEKQRIAETPGYTTHVEPERQGGAEYHRCEDCGRELLVELGGKDRLAHADGCANGGSGQ